MSSASPVKANTDTAGPVAVFANSPVEHLVQRLSAEVDAADERVHSLQTAAAEVFIDREERLLRFVAVADRVQAILLPRLQAFANVRVFNDVKQTVALETRGPAERGFHSRTTTLVAPYSDQRPAPMEFSFRIGHDVLVANAVMDYRVQILPIFIKFKSHDQLVIPIDDPCAESIAEWIDDKLVQFTKTYFEVYFNGEYQKKSLEIDPVMNIQFPRALAVAKAEYQKRTFHFYTIESRQLFEKNPSAYI